MNKYDAILYFNPEETINESDRKNASKNAVGADKFVKGSLAWDDPRLFNQHSFGQILRSSLNNIGNGWSCNVTDFNKWVVVEMSHHDTVTGRTSSKTFLVVFQEKGDGIVLSTNNKYRSISGAEQAVSYIKNASGALRDSNQTKL